MHHTILEAAFLLDHIQVAISHLPNSPVVFISDLGELNPKLYVPEAETTNHFKVKIAMKYSVQHGCLIVNLFRFFIKEVNTFLLSLTLVQSLFSLMTADLATIFTPKFAFLTKIRESTPRRTKATQTKE